MNLENNESISAKYYEETDFSEMMKTSERKKFLSIPKKQITINISEAAYADANQLDQFMNMGYQNVLKTAIALGLNDLHKAIYEKKDISEILNK